MSVTVAEFLVADPPEAWAAAGFTVDPDGGCRIGALRIRLIGSAAGTGIVGWGLQGIAGDTTVDGLRTVSSDAPPSIGAQHANGVTHLDHAVLMSPDLERSVAALASLGLQPRRQRDGELGGAPIRQVFYRCEDVVIELVGAPEVHGDGPAVFWGLTHVVADIEATAAYLGAGTGPVKDAVQPGRRITTLRNLELGISVRTALISPRPARVAP